MSFRHMLERYKTGEVTENEKHIIEEELEKFEAINDFEYERLDINLDGFHEENTEFEEAEKLTRAIKKEIRRIFAKASLITGIAVFAVVLFVMLALPNIVSSMYYNPGKAAFEEKLEDGATIGYNQMSMDLAVYTEMATPESVRSAVDVNDNGYGKYDICIRQTIASNGEDFRDVSGKIERNKMVLYDPNLFKTMSDNTFSWYQRESTVKSLTQQDKLENREKTNKNEQITHGIADRNDNQEILNNLDKNKPYYAYVTLNRMMNYEDFYKFYKKHKELIYGWCAVKTTDTNKEWPTFTPDNIGFVFAPRYSEALGWDHSKYPNLFLENGGNWDVFKSEAYASKHFISMLNYMENNKKFYQMISSDSRQYDFAGAAEYVKKNGIKVYGFVTIAEKNVLQKLLEDDEVYSVYANGNPHQ